MRRMWFAAVLACTVLPACAATASAATYGHDDDTVIVQFRPGTTAAQQRAVLGGARVIGTINGLGATVVRVTRDPALVAAVLNRSALVQYAEVNETLRASATPNDPRFGELYGLNNTGQGGGTPDADLDAPEGWDLAGLGTFPSSGGVKVGIVDTGILATHEDLVGKLANCAQSRGLGGVLSGSIQEGSCSDDNSHGTHVSGTITGNANNGKGVAGVAFNSPIAMCRALGGPLGSGSTADVANCITWLKDKGASVISMSLGGGASTTLQNAVNYAWQNGNGALIVAAAGNDGDSTQNYPAAYAQVVSVAATDNRDQRASFSNANADVEIAAAGVNVLSSTNGSNTSYGTKSGTSMATPHVAGVGALIRTRNPTFTAAQARTKLDAAVDDLGPAGRDQQFGFGRVNLVKALS
jgi:thermitase